MSATLDREDASGFQQLHLRVITLIRVTNFIELLLLLIFRAIRLIGVTNAIETVEAECTTVN